MLQRRRVGLRRPSRDQRAGAGVVAEGFWRSKLTPALKGRIEYLAGEPDRWRNVGDLPLKNFNPPDHYIDLEDLKLYDLTPETLPMMRYDFVADIAKARLAHPGPISGD